MVITSSPHMTTRSSRRISSRNAALIAAPQSSMVTCASTFSAINLLRHRYSSATAYWTYCS